MSPRRRSKPANVSEVLLSSRATPRLEALYALVVVDEFGVEGIMRRDTPFGTIPYLTDDAEIVERMLALAQQDSPYSGPQIRVATFVRAADFRTVRREPTEPVPDPGPGP
jgi:hypothetical protein